MRKPYEIMADFDAGCQGLADVDMRGVLHEVIADLLDSVDLALQGVGMSSTNRRIVRETVEDYIVNNYGDD